MTVLATPLDMMRPCGAVETMAMRRVVFSVAIDRYAPEMQADDLGGCVKDSEAITALCREMGFEVVALHNEQATVEMIVATFTGLAQDLKSGDCLLVHWSGHGTQVPDRNNDEPDALDEASLCYNRILTDDQIGRLLDNFVEGVEIVMLHDVCHGQDMGRSELVAKIPRSDRSAERIAPDASVVAISTTLTTQTAGDTRQGGIGTQALLRAWAAIKDRRPSWRDWVKRAQRNMRGQTFAVTQYGPRGLLDDEAFWSRPVA